MLTGATDTWWSMVQFIVSNLTSGTTYPADTYSLSVCGTGNTSGSGSCVHEAPLSESGWTASSNANYGEDIPQNAITNVIDGTDATRFSSDQDQAPGLYYEVNLGSAQSFNAVDMDSGGYGSDYAQAYTIAVSDNGTSWTTVTDGTGGRTPEVAAFPTQTAQYIRVTLDEGSSDNWWSIVDFSLLAENAGWTASTNTSGDAAAAIDGNPATRFTSGADQAAGMSWELDLGAPEQFDEIVMDSTDWPGDFARGYEVQVSDNGTTWTTVDSGTGSGSPESATFALQDAQYIKVTLTAPSTTSWWSIGDSWSSTRSSNRKGPLSVSDRGLPCFCRPDGTYGHAVGAAGRGFAPPGGLGTRLEGNGGEWRKLRVTAEASEMVTVPRAELDALRAEVRRLRREVGRGVARARMEADPGPGDAALTLSRSELAEAWGISE